MRDKTERNSGCWIINCHTRIKTIPAVFFPLKKLYQATSMALLLACGGIMLAAVPGLVDSTTQSVTVRKTFKIPAGTLAAVLQQYAAAGISYHLKDSAAATQKSNGLSGEYTPEQGLLTLLAGHGSLPVPMALGAIPSSVKTAARMPTSWPASVYWRSAPKPVTRLRCRSRRHVGSAAFPGHPVQHRHLYQGFHRQPSGSGNQRGSR